MSTILLLCVIGILGFSRSVNAEHNGKTNRTRCSYNANKRINFGDTVPSVSACDFVLAADLSYAAMVFELRCLTSKTYTGIPRLSLRPVHCGYCTRSASDSSAILGREVPISLSLQSVANLSSRTVLLADWPSSNPRYL